MSDYSVVIDPKDFDKICGYYKYVRFADGKVLFCDATNPYAAHKSITNEYSKSLPVSAGTIKTRMKKWWFSEGGSTTLNLGSDYDVDGDAISALLKGKKYDPDAQWK